MEKQKSNFELLNNLNVNAKTEKKNNLTYLSWAWAWTEFCKVHPDATYKLLPYTYDENLGYMVYTEVIADGIKRPMWLPVMDGANKAMKSTEYTYKVKEYKNRQWTGNYIDKGVEQASMFDINTAYMRCLTKNLAMFGLGLYIYAGEDIPEQQEIEKPETKIVQPEAKEEKKEKIEMCPEYKGWGACKLAIKNKTATLEYIKNNYALSKENEKLLTQE